MSSTPAWVLTPDELLEFQTKIEDLMQPYLDRSAEHRPSNTRRARLLSFVLPDADRRA